MLSILTITLNLSSFLLLILGARLTLQWAQQTGYRPERYRKRLFDPLLPLYKKSGFLTYGVISFAMVLLAWSISTTLSLVTLMIATIQLCYRTYKKVSNEKKPLVYTQRVKRLCIALSLTTFLCAYILSTNLFEFTLPITTALIPFLMFVTLFIVKPIENRINQFFLDDARKKISSLSQLTTIGITGSYGKTSTKLALSQVLSQELLTLCSPGSVNTELGLARIVREEIKNIHQVFIAEMGARQKGDIALCASIVKPKFGIITTIGEAHLETFGSRENIARTKYELIESLPSDGVAFFNADNDFTKEFVGKTHCKSVTFALKNTDADFQVREIKTNSSGSSFTLYVKENSKEYQFQTSLLGAPNIYNLAAAIAVATELGISFEKIQFAVREVKPAEHRLVLMKKPNNTLVIDDAYNSNPVGFKAAVDVLESFAPRNRILVTPGMVELGDREFDLNKEVATYAATKCDAAVIVGSEQRRTALKEGLLAGGLDKELLKEANSLAEAHSLIAALSKGNDIILFENDLPDLYGG